MMSTMCSQSIQYFYNKSLNENTMYLYTAKKQISYFPVHTTNISLTSDLPIVKKYASSLLGIISFPSAVLAVILDMLVQKIFKQLKKIL